MQADPTTTNPKSVVQSFAKGFRILEAFSAEAPEMTLSEIANRAELDPGTAFRMVNTLNMLGYLERVGASKRYRLSLKVLDLGFTAIGRMELRDLARPVLLPLVGEINEAASVGVLDGTDVLYVERVQAGMARLGVDVRIGSRIPAYYTVIGWSLLAFLPEDERRAILERSRRTKLSPEMIIDVEEIERGLADVRAKGFACHDRHMAPGLRFLAAPVMDADKRPVASVSVAAPSMNVSADEFVRLAAEPVKRAADKLSRALSVRGPVAPSLAPEADGA